MERKCNKTAQARVPVLLKHSANRLFPQPVRHCLSLVLDGGNGCPPKERAASTKPENKMAERFCRGRSVPRFPGRNGHFQAQTDSLPKLRHCLSLNFLSSLQCRILRMPFGSLHGTTSGHAVIRPQSPVQREWSLRCPGSGLRETLAHSGCGCRRNGGHWPAPRLAPPQRCTRM